MDHRRYPPITIILLITTQMASNLQHCLLIFSALFSLVSASQSSQPQVTQLKTHTLALPVQKDSSTGLHVTNIRKRTPLVSLPLLVDLNGDFLWANCDRNYASVTYNAPPCRSTQCSRAGVRNCFQCSSRPVSPGCHNNTCGVEVSSPVTGDRAVGELAQDVLSIQAFRGYSSKSKSFKVTVPQYLFVCAPSSLQASLPKNVQGVAGLGHSHVALPTQLASRFGFSPQFSLCLTSSPNSNGVLLFGEGAYSRLPGLDTSHPATYTPLRVSPDGKYFITVTAIKINKKQIPIPTTPNNKVLGTASITTRNPYTAFEHSLFASFAKLFAQQLLLGGVAPLSQPVSPFGVCYDSRKLQHAQVPAIDFVLHSQSFAWRISRSNAMVQPKEGVSCLAFVDGGSNLPRGSIEFGAYQLEDNLVEFNLADSELGFMSSNYGPSGRSSCAGYKFNPSP